MFGSTYLYQLVHDRPTPRSKKVNKYAWTLCRWYREQIQGRRTTHFKGFFGSLKGFSENLLERTDEMAEGSSGWSRSRIHGRSNKGWRLRMMWEWGEKMWTFAEISELLSVSLELWVSGFSVISTVKKWTSNPQRGPENGWRGSQKSSWLWMEKKLDSLGKNLLRRSRRNWSPRNVQPLKARGDKREETRFFCPRKISLCPWRAWRWTEEAIDPVWSLKVFSISRSIVHEGEPVLYYLDYGSRRGFVREGLMVVPPGTELPPVEKWFLHKKWKHLTLYRSLKKDFRKVGCGVKYRNKVPRKEFKAMFGYCPQGKPEIKVEISDETGFCQVFSIMKVAAKTCMRDLKWLCYKIRHWQW